MIDKKVVIFGVFDNLHKGHLYFIKKAAEIGTAVIAIVARDEMVKKLKNKYPKNNQDKRIKDLLENTDIDEAFLGDIQIESYEIIKKIKPDLIFLGYDQIDLYNSLKKMMEEGYLEKIEIIFNDSAYQPEIFHSSIIAELGSSF
jgi:FAD synthetase